MHPDRIADPYSTRVADRRRPPIHWRRRRVDIALCMLLMAGCVSLRTGSFDGTTSAISTASQAPDGYGLLEIIRSSLGSETWQQNHNWTVKAEWEHRLRGFPSAKDLRWRFAKNWNATGDREESTAAANDERATSAKRGSGTKNLNNDAPSESKENSGAKASKAESEQPTLTSPENESTAQWDGFWPLTVGDLLHPMDSKSGRRKASPNEGIDCLRRLAHSNNLVGWNAAILWAQQDPNSAVEIADILQKLIVQPPQYVAEVSESSSTVDQGGSTRTNSQLNKLSNKTKTSPPSAAASNSSHEQERPKSKTRKTLSPATRCAAAEAWCLVLAASATDPIDGLAPAGRLLQHTELPNDLRAELFRGVARWVRPVNIPRLENAFREGQGKLRPPLPIRRAAIDACLVYAVWNQPAVRQAANIGKGRKSSIGRSTRSIWPKTVLNCRIDPDVEVRRAFVRWLGYSHIDEAFELLKSQIDGADFDLRRAALESLATLHTDEAHTELKNQSTKARDALRAIAVQSLGAWGPQEVIPLGRDNSAPVRAAVVSELAKSANLDSAVVLSELSVDRNPEIQLAAVRAVRVWPDALAFPLLLHAMRDSSAKARHEAAQAVALRREFVTAYRFDSPPDQREAAVTAIAAEIGSSLNYLDQVLKREPRIAAEVDAVRIAEIRSHLTALLENPAESPMATNARDWLTGISGRDVPVVEAYLQEPHRSPPDVIYRDILPKVSPAYAALVDLENADLNVRRRGAKMLADRGQAATLSQPVLLRLHAHMAHEGDELVWRFALSAVASDSTDECAQIANLALQHSSEVVRQLGCEYLSRHGRPAHAVWLLGLLEDRSRSVQLATIRALGNCGNQVAIGGVTPPKGGQAPLNLHRLLTSSDQEIRFAAAVSLCRLGTTEGMDELVRLSYQPNPSLRERAVKEMGLSGQSRFVDHLVTLGWTERNDQVRQAILGALERLVPPENRPPAVGGIPAWDAKIRNWVQWLERRNGSPARILPADAPLASRPGQAS
jgi:HEAT repeat protein